jgi:hypothetical protein
MGVSVSGVMKSLVNKRVRNRQPRPAAITGPRVTVTSPPRNAKRDHGYLYKATRRQICTAGTQHDYQMVCEGCADSAYDRLLLSRRTFAQPSMRNSGLKTNRKRINLRDWSLMYDRTLPYSLLLLHTSQIC